MPTRVMPRLEYALELVMGATLFFMMVLGFADVVFRYLLNSPIPGATELAGLALGVLVFGSLPLVTARGEHVTVDLFSPDLNRVAGRVRYAATLLVSAVIVGVMSWRIAIQAQDLAMYGDRTSFLGIPLAPLAWFMCLMAALTAVILLARSVTVFAPAPEPAA